MLVRIKRQKGPNEQPYWQTFEYKGSKDATVVTVLNALNYILALGLLSLMNCEK